RSSGSTWAVDSGWRSLAAGTIVLAMGLRSLRRPSGHRTSRLLGVPSLALLVLGAALITDVPASDPRLSVIYTVDDEGYPIERPPPRPAPAPRAVWAESPDLDSHRPLIWASAPTPAFRLVRAAALGGHATRAPPQA